MPFKCKRVAKLDFGWDRGETDLWKYQIKISLKRYYLRIEIWKNVAVTNGSEVCHQGNSGVRKTYWIK